MACSSFNPEGHDDIVIKQMTEDDVRTAVAWAGLEGWNPGYEDAKPFFLADEDGFFMAKLAATDQPVASISAVRYGEKYAFVGLFICAPDYRGRGYGRAVFRYAMRRLEGKVVGLDAVVAHQARYARHGFVHAHDNVRFGGVVEGTGQAASPGEAVKYEDEQVSVSGLVPDKLASLLEFDERHVPAARASFTRAWVTTTGHRVRIASSKAGKIRGYGVLRPCLDGAKIGPLFAESAEVAETLARSLVGASSRPIKIFLDVPAPNEQAIHLAGRLGLTRLWQTGRMYKGAVSEVPLQHIFGITTFELG